MITIIIMRDFCAALLKEPVHRPLLHRTKQDRTKHKLRGAAMHFSLLMIPFRTRLRHFISFWVNECIMKRRAAEGEGGEQKIA